MKALVDELWLVRFGFSLGTPPFSCGLVPEGRYRIPAKSDPQSLHIFPKIIFYFVCMIVFHLCRSVSEFLLHHLSWSPSDSCLPQNGIQKSLYYQIAKVAHHHMLPRYQVASSCVENRWSFLQCIKTCERAARDDLSFHTCSELLSTVGAVTTLFQNAMATGSINGS